MDNQSVTTDALRCVRGHYCSSITQLNGASKMNYGISAAGIEHRDATEDDVYADAWRIAEPGAVNPLAVARTLAEASKVIMNVHHSSEAVRTHPALRVIAGQLAMLFSVDRSGAAIGEYDLVQIRAKALK
jgi:hypothetical protein